MTDADKLAAVRAAVPLRPDPEQLEALLMRAAKATDSAMLEAAGLAVGRLAQALRPFAWQWGVFEVGHHHYPEAPPSDFEPLRFRGAYTGVSAGDFRRAAFALRCPADPNPEGIDPLGDVRREVAAVLGLMDGLAETWGDEGVFRRCRDRLRALVPAGEG